MINCYKDWKLDFQSDLKDYLIKNNGYVNEHIHYCQKYDEGAFTINVPTSTYRNCYYINGYPHFKIDARIMRTEIENFILGKNLYDYDFTIRYGDTHPHKPIPKLAQIRSISINDALQGLILTSGKKESVYVLGDVSQRSLENAFPNANASDYRKQLMMGMGIDSIEGGIYKEVVERAKEKIENFIRDIGFPKPTVKMESDYYKNRDVFDEVSRFSVESGFGEDGTLKYVLQEMIYVCSVLNKGGKLISILGDNQNEHVLKVNSLMKNNDLSYDVAYVTYGHCFEAKTRDKDIWIDLLEEYIRKKGWRTENGLIDPLIYLRLLFSCQNNSMEIHFDALSNYDNTVLTYFEILKCYESCRKEDAEINLDGNNDLLAEMALVYFKIHYAVSAGEQSQFFRYLYSLAKKYNKYPEKYRAISPLLGRFIKRGLELLDLAVND